MRSLAAHARGRLRHVRDAAFSFLARGPEATLAYGWWQVTRVRDALRPQSFAVDDAGLRLSLGLRPEAPLELAVEQLRRRELPRFRFDDASRNLILGRVDSAARQRTIEAAEAVLRREFTFRGIGPVHFGGSVDWRHTPDGNVDWRWDLNRHLFLETLGRAYWYTDDERYAREVVTLIEDWSRANPATSTEVNWASIFEVAIRVNTWLAALFLIRRSNAFDSGAGTLFLRGLLAHGRMLDARLERHVPNNHLLLEAKALALLAIMLPEFKEAPGWRRRGVRIVLQQIRNQVAPDGAHREGSPHYHRIVAAELLELAVVLGANGMKVPDLLRSSLRAMIAFEVWMTKPDGSLPLFSDSSPNETDVRFRAASAGPIWLDDAELRRYASPTGESELWLLPAAVQDGAREESARALVPSRLYPDGGYAVMTGGPATDAFLAFDCGPFGYPPMPTHGHADALSFELYAEGRSWLVDAGAYSMHLGRDWRNYFRGTRAHNTVLVDDVDQSILIGTRRAHRTATTTVHGWGSRGSWDVIDASHDGYARLPEPVVHRRLVLYGRPHYWLLMDDIEGQGDHDLQVLFHFDADLEVAVDRETGVCHARDAAGRTLLIAPLEGSGWHGDVVTGVTEPIQGWISIRSGQRLPAPVVRYTRRDNIPVRFSALLVPYRGSEAPARWAVRQAIGGSVDVGLLEVAVTTADYVDQLTIGRPSSGRPGQRGQSRARPIRLVRNDRAGRMIERWESVEAFA